MFLGPAESVSCISSSVSTLCQNGFVLNSDFQCVLAASVPGCPSGQALLSAATSSSPPLCFKCLLICRMVTDFSKLALCCLGADPNCDTCDTSDSTNCLGCKYDPAVNGVCPGPACGRRRTAQTCSSGQFVQTPATSSTSAICWNCLSCELFVIVQ